jgi:hypothetical protein
MLNDSNPPTTRATQACTSNTVYSKLPLYAGFFVAPDALGANVVAAFLANLVTSLSRLTSLAVSSTLFISCLSATNHSQTRKRHRSLVCSYFHQIHTIFCYILYSITILRPHWVEGSSKSMCNSSANSTTSSNSMGVTQPQLG